MTTSNTESIQIPPKPLRLLMLLASLAAGLAGAAGLWIAVFATSAVLWASVGFLVVLLIASVLGILAGTGRFAVGYGIAAVSIAGTITGSSLFAWRDLASNVGRDPKIGPLLIPWLGFESICGLAILIMGGLAVLSRRSDSFRDIGRSFAFLIPAGILLAAGYFGLGKLSDDSSGRVIVFGALLLGGLLIGILVSLGGHFLIRAFEKTAEDPIKI